MKTLDLSEQSSARTLADRLIRLAKAPPLTARYVLVSGVVGVPASIAQLTVMLALYRPFAGEVSTLSLNALWLLNFELGLTRNFLLHCAYTWGVPPTRRRLQHAHVAAIGALLIDLAAFNAVVYVTGIIPLAQLCGAGSGFLLNFSYNNLMTFAGIRRTPRNDEVVV